MKRALVFLFMTSCATTQHLDRFCDQVGYVDDGLAAAWKAARENGDMETMKALKHAADAHLKLYDMCYED